MDAPLRYVLLLVAGCGFSIPGEEPSDLDPDLTDPDPDIAPEAERKCATHDPSLRLCIDFEDVTTLTSDGSGRGHDAIMASSLSVMPREAEQAALLSASSRLLIGEHADLDLTTALTTSMWINVEEFGKTRYLLDNNDQYSMAYTKEGPIRCGLGSDTVDSVAPIWDDNWHHVACTYDRDQLKVYIDGSVAGCRKLDRVIATSGGEGTAIGANVDAGPTFKDSFIGGMDNVQVFASAHTAAQICAAAGHTTCTTQCPSWGSNGGWDD